MNDTTYSSTVETNNIEKEAFVKELSKIAGAENAGAEFDCTINDLSVNVRNETDTDEVNYPMFTIRVWKNGEDDDRDRFGFDYDKAPEIYNIILAMN